MLYKCRYYPSCSQYTIEAIDDKGIFLGLLIGLKRIMKCNPFFKGGPDPYKKQ
ncbi:MAG: membrane protein insertion efficiency factor YidD [Candidatus Omnitrophota bacterium]